MKTLAIGIRHIASGTTTVTREEHSDPVCREVLKNMFAVTTHMSPAWLVLVCITGGKS